MWRHINKAYQELLPQKARTAAGDSINRLERDLFSTGSLEKNVTDVYLALAPEHSAASAQLFEVPVCAHGAIIAACATHRLQIMCQQ